jgi:hypothetical protein
MMAPGSPPPPVRLVEATEPAPFAPGHGTVFARVAGNGLSALDLLDGDHVLLVRRGQAEHGDLAAVTEADGRACLWKVSPEFEDRPGGPARERLRLSLGRGPGRLAESGARVQGVVVAILRRR